MKDTSALEQQYSESRSTACQPAPWWLSPTVAAEPEPLQKQYETEPDSDDADSDPLNGDTWYPGADPPEWLDDSAASEFHWSNISNRCREYLTGRRNYPKPCLWCGGRLVHNRLCDALRLSWEPAMPFGKHKGRPLSKVPRDYLQWLVSLADGINDDLREAIMFRLRRDSDCGQ